MVRLMKQKCEVCGKEYKAYGCYRGNDIHICDACRAKRNKFIKKLKIDIKYDKEERDDTIFHSREANW